eukprot:TRINITY_DN47655_c0_g1_i1.p1 TRINITY_DN47655_c0_g1~~TRINITY_DN47655_c0_g1_i1.p1  ORF type:complete len:407 (+),score=98.35 TRINITY_DN47655_c0_g1_i1:149-1222(+)
MPHPYKGQRPVVIEAERLSMVSKWPAEYNAGVRVNEKLKSAVRLFKGEVLGSEGVAVHEGVLYLLDRYGWVHKAAEGEDGKFKLEKNVTYVGPGRPLGFHVTSSGIILCDSVKGIVLAQFPLSHTTQPVILHNTDHLNRPINYFNDLDVHGDTVYFSSSCEGAVALDSGKGYYDTMMGFLMNAMKGDASGRVFSFNMKTKEMKEIVNGVWYANGVAVDPTGRYLYYCETSAFRVMKVDLETGVRTPIITHLPGYPDGLTFNPTHTALYVSLVALPSPLSLVLPYPTLRVLLSHFASIFTYFSKPHGCVVKITPTGEVLDTYMDPTGEVVSSVSSVTEHNNRLYIGNLMGDYVSYYQL